MSDTNWKKLKDYRCPLKRCGYPLREIKDPISFKIFHHCTGCNFYVSDERLLNITIIKHKKLQPPAFIEEMINQDELNKL